MRNLKNLFAVILLALTLGTPVYAGDMQDPPSPNPPPPHVINQAAPTDASGDPQATTAPADFIDPTTVAFELLLGMLSIY